MKYSLPKQGKARPAKRLSFDELELVHKTFDPTVGIDDSSSGENSFFVALKPFGKALYRSLAAGLDLLLPVL